MDTLTIRCVSNGAVLTIENGDTHSEVYAYSDDDLNGWVDFLYRIQELIGPPEKPWDKEGAVEIRVVPGHEYEDP